MLCRRCMMALLVWGSLSWDWLIPSCCSCAWIERLGGKPLELKRCFPGSLMQKFESLLFWLPLKLISPISFVLPPMGMPGRSSSRSTCWPWGTWPCVVSVGVLTEDTVGLFCSPKLAAAGVGGWEVRRPWVRPEVFILSSGLCWPKSCLVWDILWLSSISIVPTASSISISATASISSFKFDGMAEFPWRSCEDCWPRLCCPNWLVDCELLPGAAEPAREMDIRGALGIPNCENWEKALFRAVFGLGCVWASS